MNPRTMCMCRSQNEELVVCTTRPGSACFSQLPAHGVARAQADEEPKAVQPAGSHGRIQRPPRRPVSLHVC
jgi:hypothetical protein